MAQGSKLLRDGIAIVQGTPTEPVRSSTLFLKMWRVKQAAGPERCFASLYMVRPSRNGYVIKELIPEMELTPSAAVDKAVAIAKRGDVTLVYLNADLTKLPPLASALSA